MAKKLAAIKTPGQIKISARTSSITNSFINGIIPFYRPTEEEMFASLEALDISREDVRCAYCGDEATEWDHLNPLVDDRAPTGYITEIANLVPSCGKCNQSKGNQSWKSWIRSSAEKSPTQRKVPGLDGRITLLEAYENRFKPSVVKLSDHVDPDLWLKHWANHKAILNSMAEANAIAETVRKEIARRYAISIGHPEKSPRRTLREKFVSVKDRIVNGSNKDKYLFDGEVLGKGRLVLAVVKRYVTENPEVDFESLKSIFHDRIQGSKTTGVFSRLKYAIEMTIREKGIKRFFLSEDDLVRLSDEIIAVSNQWKSGNIENIIAKAQELGYKIEVIKEG